MANLMFKMGNHAGLANAPIKAGTVYITKDERCMHVDIDDSTRIRIQGSVLVYDNFKSFTDNVKPPFSPDVIYLIADENALVRFDLKANNGAGKWVRLNKTAETMEAEIAALQASINSNAGKIADLEAADIVIDGRLDAVEAQAEANKVQAEANRVQAATNKTDIASNLEKINGLTTRMGTAEGNITAHAGRLDDVEGVSSQNKTDIAGLTTRMGTAEGKISANETNIGTNATNIAAVDSKADGIRSDLTVAQGKITANEGNIDGLQTLTGTHSTDISNLKGRMTQAESGIEAAKGRLDGHDTAISGINTTLGQHDTRITAAQTKANDNAGAISDLQATDTTHGAAIEKNKTDIAANLASITDHETRVSTVENLVGKTANAGLRKEVADLKAADVTINGKITANEGAIAELQQADIDLDSRLDAVEAQAEANKTQAATNKADIASNLGKINGLTTRMDTAEGKISANEGKISANEGKIADIEQDIADLVAEDTAIKGRLDAVEAKAETNKQSIAGHGTRLTAVEGVASKAASDLTALTARVSTNEGKIADIETNFATKTEVSGVEERLNASLNTHIKAANAMTFQKTVAKYEELPAASAGVKVGDTYVVSGNEGFDNNGVIYRPGDMIIASGTEDANGNITAATLVWNRVETGYNADLDPEMTLANNTIALSGKTGKELGSVAFESGNDFLQVSTVAKTNTVKFDLVWGEF